MVVVFVDDLDRCGDDTVIGVCEAVKLYLDLPGIVFVLGCDLALLARPSMVPNADRALVRSYLEKPAHHTPEHEQKISRVNYQVPVPTEGQIEALIEGYARRSGTTRIFTGTTRRLVAERSAGNPRSIKRLINSFIVEYRLDDEWRELGGEALMNAILLQHFHPDFYRLLIDQTGTDVVEDFLDYRTVRQAIHVGDLDTNRHVIEAMFKRYSLPSDLDSAEPDVLRDRLDRLEQEVPAGWPELARQPEFASLLEGIGTAGDRRRLQQRLRRQPLSTAPVTASPLDDLSSSSSSSSVAPDRPVRGLRVLWIDDDPLGHETMIVNLAGRGGRVAAVRDIDEALNQISFLDPHVVISDVTRQGVHDAGFRDAAQLRRATGYRGPIFFYTRAKGPERAQRTLDLAPASITTSSGELLDWLETLAGWIDREEFTTPEFLAEQPWLPDAPINQVRHAARPHP
jgi:CheY-like chemotaxis protein